jgi:Uma2 family endonuclease
VVVVLNQNREIITPSRIIGTPDLVVEIASPATAGYDRREKQDAYSRAGVPEYWIADAGYQSIEILTLGDSGYLSKGIFHGEAMLPTTVIPNLPVPVEQFFGNE